MSRLPHGRAW